jgi:hypothetical protein
VFDYKFEAATPLVQTCYTVLYQNPADCNLIPRHSPHHTGRPFPQAAPCCDDKLPTSHESQQFQLAVYKLHECPEATSVFQAPAGDTKQVLKSADSGQLFGALQTVGAG